MEDKKEEKKSNPPDPRVQALLTGTSKTDNPYIERLVDQMRLGVGQIQMTQQHLENLQQQLEESHKQALRLDGIVGQYAEDIVFFLDKEENEGNQIPDQDTGE